MPSRVTRVRCTNKQLNICKYIVLQKTFNLISYEIKSATPYIYLLLISHNKTFCDKKILKIARCYFTLFYLTKVLKLMSGSQSIIKEILRFAPAVAHASVVYAERVRHSSVPEASPNLLLGMNLVAFVASIYEKQNICYVNAYTVETLLSGPLLYGFATIRTTNQLY